MMEARLDEEVLGLEIAFHLLQKEPGSPLVEIVHLELPLVGSFAGLGVCILGSSWGLPSFERTVFLEGLELGLWVSLREDDRDHCMHAAHSFGSCPPTNIGLLGPRGAATSSEGVVLLENLGSTVLPRGAIETQEYRRRRVWQLNAQNIPKNWGEYWNLPPARVRTADATFGEVRLEALHLAQALVDVAARASKDERPNCSAQPR
jgi:hypothetical protein